MPELEQQIVTSSSPLIASETIEETTMKMGNEGDMMNEEDDKVSDAGVIQNKMMYTSTEETEFYETSPETTTDDTEIISRQEANTVFNVHISPLLLPEAAEFLLQNLHNIFCWPVQCGAKHEHTCV